MPSAQIEVGSIAQWASAGATLLAVLVALFKDEMLRWLRKPKLIVRIKLAPPDCQKTTLHIVANTTGETVASAECYYLRLWIENTGKTTAQRVQVFAARLMKQQADQSFREVDGFLPMNLRWAHGQLASGLPEIFAEGISPNMGKHCDLGHLVDPQHRALYGHTLDGVASTRAIVALDVEAPPATFSHLIAPGVYRLELRIAGSNSAPVSKVLEINVTGNWFPDQKQMFSDGLGIRVLA
jgi:hypothetical protein